MVGAAASLMIKGHYKRKSKKIKEGGIVTKKTTEQIKKNKRVVMLRKAKAHAKTKSWPPR